MSFDIIRTNICISETASIRKCRWMSNLNESLTICIVIMRNKAVNNVNTKTIDADFLSEELPKFFGAIFSLKLLKNLQSAVYLEGGGDNGSNFATFCKTLGALQKNLGRGLRVFSPLVKLLVSKGEKCQSAEFAICPESINFTVSLGHERFFIQVWIDQSPGFFFSGICETKLAF